MFSRCLALREGEPLGADEYVVSSDGKTSVQARCHPTLAPGQARAMRVNHEYGRGGALAYLAAYDVHQAKVFGRCEATTGIVPFMDHTPVHASWTNQIEIFFSIVQRKDVSPSDFTDLTQVRNRLRTFEDRYNAAAQPFQWKFTTSGLDELLARLDRHTSADRPGGLGRVSCRTSDVRAGQGGQLVAVGACQRELPSDDDRP
ncbi:hypothetical protein [Streptacidiphilus sp. EB129]|uniref:hypothetical protein n=1 Tax=Streptacidiphilus sp. EB129 TaxID=3156262 RepID=UPI0035123A90